MSAPAELTPILVFADRVYELLLKNGVWHLYSGPRALPNFGHFLILKADPLATNSSSETTYKIGTFESGRNVCSCFGNVWVIRDKYMKLVGGQSSSMTYQPYRQRQAAENQAPLNLATLQRLSLDKVFDVLAGR